MPRPPQKTSPTPQDRIAAYFERVGFGPEDRVVVAFSGGPDSTFLLKACVAIFGADRVTAAHLNHALRGKEADDDESFCRETTEKLGVRYFSETADVAKAAKSLKASLEEIGRRLRYDFLEHVRAETGARFVATGHTLDDQAETVLFRFAKGTGIRGLTGIPEMSGTVIRPMLSVPKLEILSELARSETAFRKDSSNEDSKFDRNRIRISVIPELAKINPSVVKTLTDFADYATELDAYLESVAKDFLKGGDSFSIAEFSELSSFLQKEILARLYVRASGTGVGLSTGMVDEMLRFVSRNAGGKEKAFGNLVLRREKGRILTKTGQ
jgi:tRNA(Ile)-lysidine synthase